MHRTYSMRQSRAPTASQIQNPPPPSSSTKANRLFGKAHIGHTFRKSAAGAFGPDLAKKLSQLVKMEKNVMRSMELVGRERMEVAQQLSIWGEGCDDDVSDVTDKLGVLIYEIGELEDQFVDRYDQYRVTIKSIRNIEASVQPSRDRKQKITDQIAQLKYKEPNSPKIVVLEQELVRAEAESLVAEAQLSNITREKLKAAFNYQFDALREHSEKMAIIAGYGKHLLELVDDTPVTPGETRNAYDGYETSKAIIQDCEDSLTNWVEQNAAVKSKLSTRARTLSQRRSRSEKLKAAFNYQFDALREHSEKMAIIAGYGKHLLELVDDTPVTPGETRNAYDGYETSKAIIQDCEDSLTNWVEQNAAVKSKLSTRARTLSQRRSRKNQGEGVDLAGQDAPMEGSRESGMWVPASHHDGGDYDEDDVEEDGSTANGDVRGREEERAVAA